MGWGSALPIIVLLGLMGVGADTNPYFPGPPADEEVIYLEAGRPFNGLKNIMLYDSDTNGTADGTILIDATMQVGFLRPVTVSRGVYEGASEGAIPGAEPACNGGDSPGPTEVVKCRYFCPEFPATTSPSSEQAARCDQWPPNITTASAQHFSLRYWRDPATNLVWTNRSIFDFEITGEAQWGSDVLFANPFRRVCVTIATASQINYYEQGGQPPAGTRRCWNLLYRVPARVASCQFDLSLPRRACRRDIFPDALNPIVKVGVGQTLVTHVYFDVLTGAESIEIAVASDPGLPNGASIGPLKGGPDFVPGDVSNAITPEPSDPADPLVRYVYHREITFTPTERDAIALTNNPEAGVTYPLCFLSINNMNGTAAPIVGPKVCTKIMVVRPEPMKAVEITCPSCTAPLPINFTAMVRCPYTWNMILWERKDFDPTYGIDGQAPPAAEGQVPPLPVSGYKDGLYQPRAELDPAHPLPMGAQLMEPTEHILCRDAPKAQPFDTTCEDTNLQRKVWTQELAWRPTRGMENTEFHVCFLLSGARGIDPSVVAPQRVCSTVLVSKCKVCTLPGDTLETIAKEYQTDWLQLWGANVLVDNPRNLAGYGNVTIGPTYVTSKEVELTSIVAGVFGMTMEGFIEVNPDLRGVTQLGRGTPVCVLPPVCKGPDPDMPMGM